MGKINIAELKPYISLATELKDSRHFGGNMFRHMLNTCIVLIDYGYEDSILLKAAAIHDLIEDIPNFNTQKIVNLTEGEAVLNLVMEVTKQPGQCKADFLKQILFHGSKKAQILKVADRIVNIYDLGFVTQEKFIYRYICETEEFVLPMALNTDINMYDELLQLCISRSEFLRNH